MKHINKQGIYSYKDDASANSAEVLTGGRGDSDLLLDLLCFFLLECLCFRSSDGDLDFRLRLLFDEREYLEDLIGDSLDLSQDRESHPLLEYRKVEFDSFR